MHSRSPARKSTATLVLVGNVATDDPEGQEVFESICQCREDRIFVLSVQDSALVNALQRRAAVVLQKSIREGFGLTVAEAMWKGTVVIGGNVGGIRHQIDGRRERISRRQRRGGGEADRPAGPKDPDLRDDDREARRRKRVARGFLMTRLIEDWLDLIGSFEPHFDLTARGGA